MVIPILSNTVARFDRKAGIRAIILCIGCLVSSHALQPASAAPTDPGKLSGSYALDLEAPSPATRGKCVAIGITALGTPQEDVRLVARLPNLLPGASRSASETVKIIQPAALRASRIDVCLDEVRALRGASDDGLPGSLEIAVFAVGRLRAPADSSAVEHDGLRLSDWIFLPAPAWKFKPGSAAAR